MAILGVLLAFAAHHYLSAGSSGREVYGATTVSRAAADRCKAKLKQLEEFALRHPPDRRQTMQFSEEEVNSYLALELSSKYHPSLKSLVITFEEKKLRALTTVDFDRLGETSSTIFPKLVSALLSGTHTISAYGELVSGKGKAKFVLEEAKFDSSSLPKRIVEEIISAVGRKQNPPFDPLQPSELPYRIDRVDVRRGQLFVYQ